MSEEGYRLISPRGRPKIYTQTLRQLIDSASYDGKPSIVLTTKRISAEITNLGENLWRFMALLIQRTIKRITLIYGTPLAVPYSIPFNSTATIQRHSLQFDCHSTTAFLPSIRLPRCDGIPFNSTATMRRHSFQFDCYDTTAFLEPADPIRHLPYKKSSKFPPALLISRQLHSDIFSTLYVSFGLVSSSRPLSLH